jgi:hypothetical protein
MNCPGRPQERTAELEIQPQVEIHYTVNSATSLVSVGPWTEMAYARAIRRASLRHFKLLCAWRVEHVFEYLIPQAIKFDEQEYSLL